MTIPHASTVNEASDGPTLDEVLGTDDRNGRLAGWLRRAPWRAVEPLPGTVAARHPEPDAVTVARVMDADGLDVDGVVDEIERLGIDRTRLEEAMTYWARQLGSGPSDDFGGYRVLRALERAVRSRRMQSES